MKIVTHDGNFHTDDIFAVATLLHIYPDAQVIRSRDPEVRKTADIIVDTGGEYDPAQMRFDHHQPGGAGERPNGIQYAAFGLVWKEFGERISGGAEAAAMVDQKLVAAIDAIDNGMSIAHYIYPGVREYSLSDFLYSYVERESVDPAYLYTSFLKLVEIARGVVGREAVLAQRVAGDAEKVRQIVAAAADKRIIVLPEPMSWKYALQSIPEVMFVIYPRKEGGWGVKSPRVDPQRFEVRKPMPESWITDTPEAFRAVTGVPDAQFMHRGRWYAGAETREGALKLAQIALNS